MSPNQEFEMYFTLIYSSITKKYSICPSWTIDTFINFIKSNAYNDFNISKEFDIEIVESYSYYNINARNPQFAPSVRRSQKTIREKYDGKYQSISFYIRPIIIPREQNVSDDDEYYYDEGDLKINDEEKISEDEKKFSDDEGSYILEDDERYI